MYGDFLWDLVSIAFWPEVDFIGEYLKYNKNNSKINLTDADKRIRAYLIILGVHSLIFMAKRDREDEYIEVLEVLGKFSIL
jgi:hypothetical protein